MKPPLTALIRLAGGLLAIGLLSTLQAETGIQIRRTVIPLEIAQLSTAELIDRLQDETGETIKMGNEGSYVRFAALEQGFAPLDAPAFWGGPVNEQKLARSPIMAELVSRGTASLPLLLEHLTDARPTRCLQNVRFSFGGPAGFGDHYDSRYRREPDRRPTTVNLITRENFKKLDTKDYTLRVGDLCYYAVGQIINRQLRPIGGGLKGNNRAMVINSPVESPALAAAARAEWQNLTKEEHAASLLADAQADETPSPHVLGEPALKRLLYYYPAIGKPEAERRLANLLTRADPRAIDKFVRELDGFTWPSLVEMLHQPSKVVTP